MAVDGSAEPTVRTVMVTATARTTVIVADSQPQPQGRIAAGATIAEIGLSAAAR